MIYLGAVIGVILVALGVFEESSLICEILRLVQFSDNQINCTSTIWDTPSYFIFLGILTIVSSLTLVWVKARSLRFIWFIGLCLILLFYLMEGIQVCGGVLCGLFALVGIGFYVTALTIWTLVILGINLLLKHLRSRKIKSATK